MEPSGFLLVRLGSNLGPFGSMLLATSLEGPDTSFLRKKG